MKNYGPLWTYSTTIFENSNGLLSRYFNGPSEVSKQICTNFNTLKAILSSNVFLSTEYNHYHKNFLSLDDCTVFGNGTILILSPYNQQLVANNLDLQSFDSVIQVITYKSCKINHMRIVPFPINLTRFIDSFLLNRSGEFLKVSKILVVIYARGPHLVNCVLLECLLLNVRPKRSTRLVRIGNPAAIIFEILLQQTTVYCKPHSVL